MATVKTLPSGSFQVCVRHKALPKPFWSTFDTFDEADSFGRHLESLLAQGIVPKSLLDRDSKDRNLHFMDSR